MIIVNKVPKTVEAVIKVPHTTAIGVVGIGRQGLPGDPGPQGPQGVQGPKGDQGDSGSAASTYTQPFSGLASVAVVHNLGRYPSVIVVDSAGDEVYGDIHYDTINQLTVVFSSATGGTIFCN